MATNASKLILESKLITNQDELSFFAKMRAELEKVAKGLIPQTRQELEGLFQTATKLAKTPFLSRENLAQAEKDLLRLQDKIVAAVKSSKDQASMTPKKLDKKDIEEYIQLSSGVARSRTRLNEIDKAHAQALREQEEARQKMIKTSKELALAELNELKRQEKEKHDQSLKNVQYLNKLKTQYAKEQEALENQREARRKEQFNAEVTRLRQLQKLFELKSKGSSDPGIDRLISQYQSLNTKTQKGRELLVELGRAHAQLNRFVAEDRSQEVKQKRLLDLERQRQAGLEKLFNLQSKGFTDPKIADLIRQYQALDTKTTDSARILDKIKVAHASLNRDLAEQKSRVGFLGHEWEKFQTVFSRVLAALTSFVIIDWSRRIFVGFFESLIKSNQLIEVFEARLRSLIPNSETLKGIWDELKEVTITTPFTLQALTEASVLMRAFGVDIRQNIRQVADWAVAIGKDVDDVGVAFGKIATFSPRTSLLLSTRGLSLAAFESYVSQYGNRVIALNRLIEDTFGGTAQRVSSTFEGLLTNISDLWTFISQKLGEPLFEGLKRDVEFVYNTLRKLETNAGGLTAVGEGINFIVKTLGSGLIVGGLSLLAGGLANFVEKIKFSTQAWTAFTTTGTISAIVAGLGLVGTELFKIKDSFEEIANLQAKLDSTNPMSYRQRIDILEQINKEYEYQLSLFPQILKYIQASMNGWSGGIPFLVRQNSEMEKSLLLNKQQIEYLKIKNQLLARQRVEWSTIVDAMSDFDVSKNLSNSNFKMDEVIASFQKQLKELKAIEFDWGVDTVQFQGMNVTRNQVKDNIFLKESVIDYLKALQSGVSEEEALAKVRENLVASSSEFITDNSMLESTFVRIKQTIKELSEVVSNYTKKQDDAGTSTQKWKSYYDELIDLQREFFGQKAEFQSLTQPEETIRESRLKNLKTQVEYTLGTNFSEKDVLNFIKEFEEKIEQFKIDSKEQTIELDVKVRTNDLNLDSDLKQIAIQAAEKYKINSEVFLRQLIRESGFGKYVMSAAGAVGFGQLMPGTATDLGLKVPQELLEIEKKINAESGKNEESLKRKAKLREELVKKTWELHRAGALDERFDPMKNINASALYDSQLLKRYGDVTKMLAAYNSGMRRVDNDTWQKIQETRDYVNAILNQIPDSIKEKFKLPSSADTEKSLLEFFKSKLDNLKQAIDYYAEVKKNQEAVAKLNQDIAGQYADLTKSLLEFNNQIENTKYDKGIITAEEHRVTVVENLTKVKNQQIVLEERIQYLRSIQKDISDEIKRKEIEKEVNDTKKDLIDNLKIQFAITNELFSIESPDFGTALAKQFLELRKNTDAWRDSLASAFLQITKSGIKNILVEIMFGDNKKAYEEEMDSLQYKLEQARAKKQEIFEGKQQVTIIEDEEAKVLAEINKLEEERGSIIKNTLNSVIREVGEKLADVVTDYIVQELLRFAGAELAADNLLIKEYERLKILEQILQKEIEIAAVKTGSSAISALGQITSVSALNAIAPAVDSGGGVVRDTGGSGLYTKNVYTENREVIEEQVDLQEKSVKAQVEIKNAVEKNRSVNNEVQSVRSAKVESVLNKFKVDNSVVKNLSSIMQNSFSSDSKQITENQILKNQMLSSKIENYSKRFEDQMYSRQREIDTALSSLTNSVTRNFEITNYNTRTPVVNTADRYRPITTNTSNRTVVNNVNVGNVYDMNDFTKKVDNTLKELNRGRA